MILKIGEVAMIVIDPISAFLGGTDSRKNADIRALLHPLCKLAAGHEAAVVCVSHLNKTSGGEPLLRVTGSLAFVAAARSAWIVAKDRDDPNRRLFLPLKNNIGNDQTGGKLDHIKFLEGEKLTRKQAIQAKCYNCSDGYEEGIGCVDFLCPLVSYCPYNRTP